MTCTRGRDPLAPLLDLYEGWLVALTAGQWDEAGKLCRYYEALYGKVRPAGRDQVNLLRRIAALESRCAAACDPSTPAATAAGSPPGMPSASREAAATAPIGPHAGPRPSGSSARPDPLVP